MNLELMKLASNHPELVEIFKKQPEVIQLVERYPELIKEFERNPEIIARLLEIDVKKFISQKGISIFLRQNFTKDNQVIMLKLNKDSIFELSKWGASKVLKTLNKMRG